MAVQPDPAAFGLPVARYWMAAFDGQRCLIVERFDRRLHPSGSPLAPAAHRGLSARPPPHQRPTSTKAKAGLAWWRSLQLLAQSVTEHSDLPTFFKAQVLFWMLRAIDGHAKNFSLFLQPRRRFQLTPLYDVLSAWPVIGRRAGQWPSNSSGWPWPGMEEEPLHYKPLEITRPPHADSPPNGWGLAIVPDRSCWSPDRPDSWGDSSCAPPSCHRISRGRRRTDSSRVGASRFSSASAIRCPASGRPTSSDAASLP